jgi:hypothetical protein
VCAGVGLAWAVDRSLLLAFLPQHVWQTIGTFMGVVVIAWMVYILVAGRILDANWSPRRLRALAVVGLLIGVGFIVTAWTVNAEPPCGACSGDHWGGAFGVTLLIAFLGFAVALQVLNVRDERRQRRKVPDHE